MLRRKTSSKGHRTHHDDIPDSLHAPKKVCRQGSGRRPEHIQRNHSRHPYGLDNNVVQSKHYDRNNEQPCRNSPNHGDPYCFPTSKENWVVVISFTSRDPSGTYSKCWPESDLPTRIPINLASRLSFAFLGIGLTAPRLVIISHLDHKGNPLQTPRTTSVPLNRAWRMRNKEIIHFRLTPNRYACGESKIVT